MDLQKVPPKKKLTRKRKGLLRARKEVHNESLRDRKITRQKPQKNFESVLDQLQQKEMALAPEELEKLFNTLPIHAHKTNVYVNNTIAQQRQKVEESFKNLKKIDWNKKIEGFILLKNNAYLREALPLWKSITLQKEIQLLKDIQEQALLLQQKFPIHLLQPFAPDFLALTHRLQYNLSQYFLCCQPLETLITQLPMRNSAARFNIFTFLHNVFKKKSVAPATIARIQNAFTPTAEERENLISWQILVAEILALSFGTNPLHQTFSGIIAGFYSKDSLFTLAEGMLDQVPTGELFYVLQEHYIVSSLSKRKLLLELFTFFIQLDRNYHLVDHDGHVIFLNSVYQSLIDAHLDQDELTLLEPIKIIIEEHAQQQKQNRLKFQKNLSNGLKPSIVLQTLESAAIACAANVKSLRSLLLLTYDILEFAPKTYFSQEENPQFLSAIRDVIALIPLSSHSLMHTHFQRILERRLQETMFTSPEWLTDPLPPVHSFTPQQIALDKQFELIAQGKLSSSKYKKLVKRIIGTIQSHYSSLFAALHPSELKAFILVMYIKNEVDPALFSSLEAMINFEQRIRCLIPEIIFYQMDSTGKKPRTDMKGINNLLDFFKEVYFLASQKGLWHTALLLKQSFNHPALNCFRVFGLQDIPAGYSNVFPFDQWDFDHCPLMDNLIFTLNAFKENCQGAQLFFALGLFFTTIVSAQEKAKNYKYSNFFSAFLEKRLYDKTTARFDPVAKSYTMLWDKLDKKYVNIANLFMITTDKIVSLSFHPLLKHIQSANALGLPMVIVRDTTLLTGKEGSAFLLSTVQQKIQQNKLPSIQLLGNLLKAMKENKHMENTFIVAKEFAQLLKSMQDSIEAHLNKKIMAIDVLSSLKEELDSLQSQAEFQQYLKDPMGDVLQKTYNNFKNRCNSWPLDGDNTQSQAYLKTLNTYLAGKQQFQLELPVSAKQAGDNNDSLTVEFEEYEDESNPEIIGYADTWNVFKRVAESQISGPPFSFHNIKETLIRAFPWTIEDTKQLDVNPIMDNLLYITPSLALELQKTVMDLVFVAVDNIGKLSGVHGELVLHNLPKIDNIVQTLEEIAQLLNNPKSFHSDEQAKQFKILLESKIESIKQHNQVMYEKLAHQRPLHKTERLAPNAPLNQLLHLNEKECHRHIIAHLPDSSLTFDSVLTSPLPDSQAHVISSSRDSTSVDAWALLAEQISQQFDQEE